MGSSGERLFEGADWDFQTLQRVHDACEKIARTELGLDVYPNQIEVITAEQMLDAYSSVGMPCPAIGIECSFFACFIRAISPDRADQGSRFPAP